MRKMSVARRPSGKGNPATRSGLGSAETRSGRFATATNRAVAGGPKSHLTLLSPNRIAPKAIVPATLAADRVTIRRGMTACGRQSVIRHFAPRWFGDGWPCPNRSKTRLRAPDWTDRRCPTSSLAAIVDPPAVIRHALSHRSPFRIDRSAAAGRVRLQLRTSVTFVTFDPQTRSRATRQRRFQKLWRAPFRRRRRWGRETP